jgi:hypothetical protein
LTGQVASFKRLGPERRDKGEKIVITKREGGLTENQAEALEHIKRNWGYTIWVQERDLCCAFPRPTATINSLCNKGYLEKRQAILNGHSVTEYRAIP